MDIPFVEKDAVRTRFVELGLIFDLLRDTMGSQLPNVELEIDSKKLLLAVQSYFIDIARYKWWHFDKPEDARIDNSKKAAYTAYWLNKLSPVYAKRKSPVTEPDIRKGQVPEDASLLGNIYYTAFVSFSFLDFVLADEFLDKLLYHMLWREESAKHYLLLFEFLDAAAHQKVLFLKTS